MLPLFPTAGGFSSGWRAGATRRALQEEALAAVIPRSTLACLHDHSGVAARKRWGEPRIFLWEMRSVAPQPPPARLWEACASLRHHKVGETSAGWPLHREGSTRGRSALGVNNIARSHRYRRRGRSQRARLERRALTLRDAWRAPQDSFLIFLLGSPIHPSIPHPSIPHPPIPHPSIPPFQESTEGSSRRRPTFSVNVTTSRARTLEERASGYRARAGTGVRCEAHGEHCKIVSWSSSLLLHSQFRPLQPKRQRAFAGIFHTLCRAGRDFHLHSICTPLRVIHRALRCHPDFS